MSPSARDRALTQSLNAAIGVLNLNETSSLYRDFKTLKKSLSRSQFQIAVFGPFNYGKSTLLNALLGQRTLPIDLIPTTGAAIRVTYGENLETKIILKSGQEIREAGTDILKQYAILDDRRRMRDDVEAVDVFFCHPFLKTGVEFLDLPGTNDRQEQDNLVRDRLLSADLVVQVLDARKLMTLGEREHLRDWLIDRQITTVIFVANFLNLLEPDDRKKVFHRLRFVAESFRSQLPPGIGNLYRVDALPALRARLKGDVAAAQETGLSMFESALQHIAFAKMDDRTRGEDDRLPKLRGIADRVAEKVREKIANLETEITALEQKHQAKINLQQKASQLLGKSFRASLSDFQSWLYLPKLLERYQTEMAMAIEQRRFVAWETETFKPAVRDYQQAIAKTVSQACEFFGHPHPGDLNLAYPSDPHVASSTASPNPTQSRDSSPVAVATGLGFVFGGVAGAAVAGGATYFLKKFLDPSQPKPITPPPPEITQLCRDAAKEYLTRFSEGAFAALQEYEPQGEKVLAFPAAPAPADTPAHHQRQLCQTILQNLTSEIVDL